MSAATCEDNIRTHIAPPQPGAPDGRLGRVLGGRYRLLAPLGRGGMGVVYKAEHVSLGHVLAVKILTAGFRRDQTAVARFQQEAAIAANLQHPNIVSARDFGHTDDGAPFLVMDFVEGESLEQHIDHSGRLPILCTLRVLHQTSSALLQAHHAGVVHRDVKPANIMLTSDGMARAMLTDFGLAVFTRGGALRLTQKGSVLATPAYASPEQLSSASVGTKTDIYSLGATAFEMLTGAPPFGFQAPGDAIHSHLHVPPPKMGMVRSDAPDGLADLVDQMLFKEPSARPSAEVVLEETSRLLEGSPRLRKRDTGSGRFVRTDSKRLARARTTDAEQRATLGQTLAEVTPKRPALG